MNRGATKRQKEKDRQQYQQDKIERREQRRRDKASQPATPLAPGEDPDLAGIVPGPQPPLF